MRRYYIFLVFLLSCSIISCSTEPTIDASSQEKFEKSLWKVQHSLSENKSKQFDNAMGVIMASKLLESGNPLSILTGSFSVAKYANEIDGLTAQEIIDKSSEIIIKKRQKEKEKEEKRRQEELERQKKRQLEEQELLKEKELNEITLLERKEKKALESEKLFSKIQVIGAFLTMVKKKYSTRKTPCIEFTIFNYTPHSISKINFNATLTIPGRTKPLSSTNFNYDLERTLKPEKNQNWRLEPNMLSDWYNIKAPDDSKLKIEITEFQNIYGEIFDRTIFTKKEKERLEFLKIKYCTNKSVDPSQNIDTKLELHSNETNSKQNNGWTLENDDKNIHLQLSSNEDKNTSISISCIDNQDTFLFFTNKDYNSGHDSVMITTESHILDETPKTYKCKLFPEASSVLFPFSISTIREMQNHNNMEIKTNDRYIGEKIFTFNIKGLKKEMEPYKNMCSWDILFYQ